MQIIRDVEADFTSRSGTRISLAARNCGPHIDDLNISHHAQVTLSVLGMTVEPSSQEGEEIEVRAAMSWVEALGNRQDSESNMEHEMGNIG